MRRCIVLLLISLSSTLCCAELATQTLNMPTARYFSYMAIQGLKDAAQNAKAGGKISDADYACISNVQIDALALTINNVLAEHFSKDEIKPLDDFYGSDLGKKFAGYTIQQARIRAGTPVPATESIELTQDEIEIVNSLVKTASAIKLQAMIETIKLGAGQKLTEIRNACSS